MNEHPYILEPYKGMNTRYHCPGCDDKEKTFVRYIDTETGKQIAPSVGKCNRVDNCGYHYTPKQYFQDNNISFDTIQAKQPTKPKAGTPQPKPISFVPVEQFKASLKSYSENNFAKFLINLFGVDVTSELISRYFIASSKHWNGSTVFWQIDTRGNIRTGKIMLYSPTTGKRIKEPFNHITWVHKALKTAEFELKQCLFGEHLLKDKIKPVAIVESEKTAIISSVYLPQFIWLAAGNKEGLNLEKCKVLTGRSVTLFPDLNAFELWTTKAKELSQIARVTVSDLLERKATEAEKNQGLDLADYLIRFDYKDFVNPQPVQEPAYNEKSNDKATITKPTTNPPAPQPIEPANPGTWEPQINELEKYFEGITLPNQPVRLNPWTMITNIPLFIESSFAIVKANNGNPTFQPYFNRLIQLKEVLTINLN